MRASGIWPLTAAIWAGLLVASAAPQRLLPESWPHEASAPQVAVGDDGTAAAVFAVGDEVWCSLSRDGGRSFDAPLRVGSAGKLERGLARGPRIAITDTALVVVAICGPTLRGQDGDLLAWRSTDRGATWNEPVRINDVVGASREGLAALAAGPGGELLCIWLDLRHVPLPGAAPGAQSGAALGTLPGDEPKRGTELWGAWSDDGGASWSANALLYASPDGSVCECCAPAVTFDPLRGRAVVLWRNALGGNRDMYILPVQRGDAPSLEPARPLDDQHWKLAGCPMAGGGVAVSARGTLLATWRREGALYAATPGSGAPRPMGTGRETAVAAAPGGFQLLWIDAEGNLMTAFDSSDASDGGDARDEHAAEPNPPLNARALGRGYNIAIAGAPDGRGPVLAVWETGEPASHALSAAVLAERNATENH